MCGRTGVEVEVEYVYETWEFCTDFTVYIFGEFSENHIDVEPLY